MNIQEPLQLLGGLSPHTFMQRHWEKKPLLIRQAIPGFKPLLDRTELLDMAAMDDVESRLVVQARPGVEKAWRFRHGPLARKTLPPFKQPGWSVLVQGMDLHDERVHALMNQFRFVPDARLDDLMISYATDGGGVGPHFDSYDVFLLQAHGRRRWRIGPPKGHESGAGHAAQNTGQLCAGTGSLCWSPVTCYTCPRVTPTMALPKVNA